MQQLTIQFEGYADEQHLSTQGTAKQCQEDAATRVESLILSWIGSKAESLKTMMFLAAMIGG